MTQLFEIAWVWNNVYWLTLHNVCAVHRKMFSTLGDIIEYTGGCSVHWGDIIEYTGVLSTLGDIMSTPGGSQKLFEAKL